MRTFIRSAFVVLVTLWIAQADVQAQDLRVIVLDFSGPGSAAVRNAAVRALSGQKSVELLPSDEVKAAGGLEGAATKLNLNAFVDGRVRKRGRRWTATIMVKAGASQEVIKTTSFRGRNVRALTRSVQRGLWGRIGGAIREADAGGGGDDEGGGDDFEDDPGEDSAWQGGKKRVVVRSFSGNGSDRMRSAIVKALSKQSSAIELVDADKAREEAAEMERALSSDEGRVAVGRELKVDAFVVGRVQRQSRRRWRAQVMVQNAKDGDKLESMTFSARSESALEREIERDFWKRAADAFAESSSPGGDEYSDFEEDDDDDDNGEDSRDEEESFDFENDAPSPLRIAAFYKQRFRNFSYNDAFGASAGFTPLSTHKTWLPTLGAEATWYPVAHFSDGAAANFGIDFRFATIVGVQADLEVPDSTAMGGVRVVRYDNSSTEWHLGARYRIEVDSSSLSIKAAYVHYSLEFAENLNANPTRPNIPDVSYSFVRLGAEGDFRLDEVIVRVNAAYLHVLGAGSDLNQIGNDAWFPDLSVGGLEGGISLAYDLLDGFEVGVGFDVRYFYYSMNNEPGDNPVAGGAVDLFLTPSIFVGYVIPGST